MCVEAFSSSLGGCVCGHWSRGALNVCAAWASALLLLFPFSGTTGAYRVAGGGGGDS